MRWLRWSDCGGVTVMEWQWWGDCDWLTAMNWLWWIDRNRVTVMEWLWWSDCGGVTVIEWLRSSDCDGVTAIGGYCELVTVMEWLTESLWCSHCEWDTVIRCGNKNLSLLCYPSSLIPIDDLYWHSSSRPVKLNIRKWTNFGKLWKEKRSVNSLLTLLFCNIKKIYFCVVLLTYEITHK